MATFVDIIAQAGAALLNVQSPARYTGGEYGRLATKDALLQTAIAFPDLYEIGMSNNALKILYNRINNLDRISCDRAFAPAPDFEALLEEKSIPLYALDTGIALKDLDVLMFTLSYELSITSVLSMLKAANLPLRAADRSGMGSPIVVAGGPCVANPLPYAAFLDFFWIGEAEDAFFHLLEAARDKKRRLIEAGRDPRGALRSLFDENPHIWRSGKKTLRAIDRDFARREAAAAVFPVPSIRIVQQHASVEIMRGCPNGCRFCFAGVWYRPMRQKSARLIRNEVARHIQLAGCREISLSSLSSGDYAEISELVSTLNDEFGARRVSFQLPSLRVSTLSLELLEKISRVRKSGLTFAVETPLDAWQIAVNKEVTLEKVCLLLQEAKKNGYKSAKFYFMIGLPVESACAEEDAIIDFIRQAAQRTRMSFHINVGVFIPKAHTPFQWAAQIDSRTARTKLSAIAAAFKRTPHKVSCHDPFTSLLEGILARGDERVGEIVEDAFRAGCRLDAWSEHLRRDLWESVFDKHRALVEEAGRERPLDGALPWDDIHSGTAKKYLQEEWRRAKERLLSPPCAEECAQPCGICGTDQGIVARGAEESAGGGEGEAVSRAQPEPAHPNKESDTHRALFTYAKTGAAAYLSHLAVIEVFSSAFLRAGIDIAWTGGYNPLPKIDFAAPLSVGVVGENEAALADVSHAIPPQEFVRRVNERLPEGVRVKDAYCFTVPAGAKKHSLPSLLGGVAYQNGESVDHVDPKEEKAYRAARARDGAPFPLVRAAVNACHPQSDPAQPATPATYFDVCRALYPT